MFDLKACLTCYVSVEMSVLEGWTCEKVGFNTVCNSGLHNVLPLILGNEYSTFGWLSTSNI